jgi:phosphoglycolate phosphatase-like HAD superfamily hydrolase
VLLGVTPQAAAYGCDAPTDLEAARRAGALAVAAGWGHQRREAALAQVLDQPDDLLDLVGDA